MFGDLVDLGFGDVFGVGLVDEYVLVFGVCVGVEGDDFYFGVFGFVESVVDGFWIVC